MVLCNPYIVTFVSKWQLLVLNVRIFMLKQMYFL